MKKILIIDDHPIVARGISELLRAKTDNTAVTAVSPHKIEATTSFNDFNLIIIDLELGDGSTGFDVMEKMQHQRLRRPVLIYTMHEEPWIKAKISSMAVAGAVSKSESLELLVRAALTILKGGTFFSPAFSCCDSDMNPSGIFKTISDRERQVLKMLCDGNTSEQIAEKISLSINTVLTYRRRLLQKFNVTNVAELIYQTKGFA